MIVDMQKRIAELEQENERLRSTIKIISQFWDWCRDSDKQQYPEYNKVAAIRAEIEK